MTSWIVPSPPQAKTESLPAATAQRALSVASWLERQTVSSVRTPADWMMPMAWFSSASRFLPWRPELGLNRMVALCMRRLALLLSLAHAPLPHAEHGLLWNRVSGLAGQHSDLSAMVRVVCDQVTEETGHVWAKALNAAIAFEGQLENFPQRSAAQLQRLFCLSRRDCESVELGWDPGRAFCGL